MNARGRVLLADDEVHVLRVLDLKFRTAGYDCVLVHDGLEAWDRVHRVRPHLVISDYQMPGLNGLDLAERMFQDKELRHVPIILLTGRGMSLRPRDLALTNIVHLVSKPFSPKSLLAMAQDMLAGSLCGG